MAWYVGVTHGQREFEAAEHLAKQGFGVFLPKSYQRIQEGRKVHARARLRFTGYIFIHCDPGAIGKISSTRGMDDSAGSALLGGASPTALKAEIIAKLRRIEDGELAEAIATRKPTARNDLVPGDLVEIADSDHVAHGQRVQYLSSERGIASVLGGMFVWKVAEGDLRRVEAEARAA